MAKPSTPPKRETGWSIYHQRHGFYYSSFSPTRKDAIIQHIGAYGEDWQSRRNKGDRCIKTVLKVRP